METKFNDPHDHFKPPAFDSEFETGKFGSYSYGGYSIGKPSPVKNFEIEELFRSEEKVLPFAGETQAPETGEEPALAIDPKKGRRG